MAYTTINDSSAYFGATLWAGNNATPRTLSFTGNSNLQPDWVWTKKTDGGDHNQVFDSVRGFGAGKELCSGQTFEQGSSGNGSTAHGFISSAVTNGFVATAGSSTTLLENYSGKNYVGWGWKAGTTSGIATNGSTTITPSAYSFNQTSGFSILKFTGNQTSGAKLAHGLGVKPSMIICKSMAGTSSWGVYHKSLGATYGMLLNTTGIKDDDASAWNDVEPDTVNITLGSSVNTNKTGDMVAYCFAEKIGYSKVGIYKGNNNVDGTFVYTGFAPKFLMVKQSDADGNPWATVDTTRNPFNPTNKQLFPSGTTVENSSVDVIDLLSNGFKCRAVNNTWNGEAGGHKNYIYMAFGQPIISNSGTPATAR